MSDCLVEVQAKGLGCELVGSFHSLINVLNALIISHCCLSFLSLSLLLPLPRPCPLPATFVLHWSKLCRSCRLQYHRAVCLNSERTHCNPKSPPTQIAEDKLRAKNSTRFCSGHLILAARARPEDQVFKLWATTCPWQRCEGAASEVGNAKECFC